MGSVLLISSLNMSQHVMPTVIENIFQADTI